MKIASHLGRLSLSLCLSLPFIAARAQSLESSTTPSASIAFGSCARDTQAQPIWDLIAQKDPNLVLLIGDNVYADTRDPARMQAAYDRLAAKESFADLRSRVPMLATWDDHDYGENDAGSDYPMRETAQKIFASFWYPGSDELLNQEGIYHSRNLQVGELKVQIIMLDTRYHRSKPERGLWGYAENLDPEATILGKAQWQWLRNELLKPADLRLIASSIQFVAKDHGYEKWANFPLERQRMLDLIQETRAGGVIFLSGDRHHAEISKLEREELAYPIYDFTSSGLTNRLDPAINTEYNAYRIDDSFAYRQRNFGLIELHDSDEPLVRLKIQDAYGDTLKSVAIRLGDLQFYQRYAKTR